MCGIDNSMNIKKGLKRIHKVIILLTIIYTLLPFPETVVDFSEEVIELIELHSHKASIEKEMVLKKEELDLPLGFESYPLVLKKEELDLEIRSAYLDLFEILLSGLLLISIVICAPYILIFLYKFVLVKIFNYFKDGFKDD